MKRNLFNIQNLIFIITGMLLASPLTAFPYTDNGNGTVTDQKTNLVWQRCSMGQNADSTCSGTATTNTWVNGISYCENLTLGGHSVWRVPSVNELKSIVKETAYNPAIDTGYFPGTVVGYYWSSSTYVDSPASAWGVAFSSGGSSFLNKTSSYYVRCVSN